MSSESDATVKANESNQPLKTLGKYQIEKKLGQGGMGTVYLATNTDLKKLVALKVLPRDKAKNPILVRRFKAEAQAAGQLEHPNIVAVYDTGEADGYLYIAMEYVEGIDLFEQVKRRGAIPVKRSIEIIKQVASALQHAHEHNIVHRDIKPSNLLLKHDGTVKVTDLGLARSIDDTLETNITRAGTTVGTVDYMAPEQARNSKSADVRSDIYSLGCTWYQMLTAEPPFHEGSVTNKLQAHAIKPLPDPREINENIPEGLFAVLQRMTAKKPNDRYQTPAELLDDLANSKLTNAAFSNEIFSDLSDHDLKVSHVIDDDEDVEDVQIPVVEPRRKKKSPAKDEVTEEPSTKQISSRKTRSRAEQESDDDIEINDVTTRKSSTSKPRTIEDTQPLKSRKVSSKSIHQEDDEEELHEESKRTSPEPSEEEPAEPSSSKTKRRQESPSSKSGKLVSGKSHVDKRPAHQAPKVLPPKRLPANIENEVQSNFNFEFLKYIGIAAGVLAAIGGVGWLIVLWSGQMKLAEGPITIPEQVPAEVIPANTAALNRIDPLDPEKTQTVTVIEPDKGGTSPGERPLTNDFDISKQPYPAWAASEPPIPNDLPNFSVGAGPVTAEHFSSLNDALRAADKAGGIIRLQGKGPYLMTNVELSNAKKVVITGATPQDQPLVIISSTEAGPAAGLTLTNGTLELRGLHFAFDRNNPNQQTAVSMISVVDGQLFVRRCSFTATGNNDVPAAAVLFSSRQDSQNVPVIQPDLLLDRVTIRGNGLTGLKVDRTTADIVIQDSLLVTGTAPAIDVSGNLNSGLADLIESKPRRIVRVVRSTLSGRKQILEVAGLSSPKPPTTSIFFQDSICTAEGAGNGAVLLSATRWPSMTSPTSGWLTNLNWTSQSTLYIGFERLIDLDKSSYRVANLDTWQRVWGKKFDSTQFQSLVWQESLLPDLATVMPHDFDNSRLPFHDLKTSQGKIPGCLAGQLAVPEFISQPRLNAIGQRAKSPSAAMPVSADSSQTKKVNLMKEDLGSILNKNDWPSETVFEVTGFGLREMTPARIDGKSVRILFLQGDGPPLKIQPKTYDQKLKNDVAGLFTIERGTLELHSANIEAQQSAKGSVPPWLIYSRNGSVILRGCQLSGPLIQELPQHQGLVQWTSTATKQPGSNDDAGFLSVNDSLLITTGVGIRFQGASGNLFVRNSIVAARNYGIDLQPIRTGTGLLPVIDLQHVTFSASKAALRVEAVSGGDAIQTPMRLFVDDCAFVTPVEIKPGEATQSAILECAGPAIEQKQIQWWGNSNGFAKEWKSLLRESGKEPITSATGWHTLWGESGDVRLLTGQKGVHLKNSLPNKWANLKAASFTLDPTSAAATWGVGGRPIGADIRAVEEMTVGKNTSPDTKSATQNQSTRPVTGTKPPIGKKNNPGF